MVAGGTNVLDVIAIVAPDDVALLELGNEE